MANHSRGNGPRTFWRRLGHDTGGVSTFEYAILAMLIGGAAVATVSTITGLVTEGLAEAKAALDKTATPPALAGRPTRTARTTQANCRTDHGRCGGS